MKIVSEKTVINSASATCSAQSTNNYMQYPKYRNKHPYHLLHASTQTSSV